MADSDKVMSLKLFIDKKTQRVLYAEAAKEVVDFLFNFLTLPLGTVSSLVSKHNSMVGCIGNLYKSVENLDSAYMKTDVNNNILLKPKPVTVASHVPLLSAEQVLASKIMYKCDGPNCNNYYSSRPNSVCPACKLFIMHNVVECATSEPLISKSGYVKAAVTYMVTDDLEVKPMSTIPIIALLNKLKVKDLNDIEERIVDFDMTEALKLLDASLRSNTSLTNVFMRAEGLKFVAKSEPQ